MLSNRLHTVGKAVSRRRFLTSLALMVQLSACSDSAAPAGFEPMAGQRLAVLGETLSTTTSPSTLHTLTQCPLLPALEAYQVSFWAYKGKASGIKVKYRDVQGTAGGGQTFLQLNIPKDGLASGANGARLRAGDSVQVTLTIDPTLFTVDFQPSGLQFNSRRPATLDFWFSNAHPDLDGDGVVDSTDDALRMRLSIWTTQDYSSWSKVASELNLVSSQVHTAVYHFSGYSVSW
jgi:hypothetical protein